MNAKRIILSLLAVTFVSGISFFLGRSVVSREDCRPVAESSIWNDAYARGLKVGDGRHAWKQAAYGHGFMRLLDPDVDNADQKIIDLAEHNMWFGIVDLDEFIRNSDASATECKAASTILAKVVLYFRTHPTTFVDAKTQSVFDRLVEERHFPGIELTGGGISIWLPRRGGSSSSTENTFEFDDDRGYRITYKNGLFVVDGKDYGLLKTGDVVDLRDPGYVYVNSVKRAARNKK